jgi:opacity protein-like surface antigen
MKQKAVVLSLLTGFALPNMANASFIKNSYVGMSVGYAQHKVKPHFSSGVKLTNFFKLRHFSGVPAGLHFGGEIFRNDSIFAAAELGADFIGAHKRVAFKDNNTALTYKVESGFSGELALKLGLVSGRVIPYARIGLIGTHWTQRASVILPTFSASAKKRMFKLGWAPGAGLIYKTNLKWATGLEYKHSMYRKHHLRIGSEHIHIKPHSHDVRLRLSYSI